MRNLRLGGFGSLRRVAKAANICLKHFDIGFRCLRALLEAINIQLGIARFYGADNSDNAGFGQHSGHDAVDVAAFFGASFIGEDIFQTLAVASIAGCAPGERDIREVFGDFKHRFAVLRAVHDHQIIPLAGIVTRCCRCVWDLEQVFGNTHVHLIRAAQRFLNGEQGIDHTLRPGQVILGTWRDHGDLDFGFNVWHRHRGGCCSALRRNRA